MKTKTSFFGLVARGLAMGAADVVPGVSGGTIAFITGIYEELIDTIGGVNFKLLSTLRKEGLKAFWSQLNGNFLVALFLGIGISIASLAKLITYLLDNYPILVWSFFFGLVTASILLVGKQVKKWNFASVFAFVLGSGIAYWITILPPMQQADASWYIFISGMIAICAMILPGISGSFILLLLGSYQTVLTAIKEVDLIKIATFGLGCIIGLLSFSKFLKWLFSKYENFTVAVLAGFLLGSLNKIWPWRHINQIFVKHLNEPNEQIVTLNDQPVWPNNYDRILRIGSDITGYEKADPQLIFCLALMLCGFLLIFFMEKFGNKNSIQK